MSTSSALATSVSALGTSEAAMPSNALLNDSGFALLNDGDVPLLDEE